VKLVWSKAAVRDLLELAEYFAQDSEQTAALVEARIHEEAKMLPDFRAADAPDA